MHDSIINEAYLKNGRWHRVGVCPHDTTKVVEQVLESNLKWLCLHEKDKNE